MLLHPGRHGHFDLRAYLDYDAGRLRDHASSSHEVAMALAALPVLD